MSGNLMQYSGLLTKTRAMEGCLLSKDELQQMTELATVNEAINFLKNTRAYGIIFQGRDEVWHRGQAEAVIVNSLYQDFEKLYRFADAKQRQSFIYILFRYEINILKLCLKQLFQTNKQGNDVFIDDFFYKHVRFSMDKVEKASTLQEFEQSLQGTIYEKAFMQMHKSNGMSYVDYAMGLDIYFYTSVFKSIKRMKRSELKEILLEIYGTQIDWLNIMWIYRSKRFYGQTQAELVAATIPYVYRLKKEELKALLNASELSELNKILENTGYFKGKDAYVQMEDEISYHKIMDSMYKRVCRKHGVSIAPVLGYLYRKEQEIGRLTTILEGIRYQLPAGEIKDLILITV